MDDARTDEADDLVPDAVIPHKNLQPLRYRDLPEPISWKKMAGPSIVLAGLALGSGEFILWPYLTYKIQFVFFWACVLGVITQFFLNMEIERWTLATGESAITGFCRLSKHWAWAFLLMNIIPWAWPAWATGAGNMLGWTIWGKGNVPALGSFSMGTVFGIAGLIIAGVILTAGPVVYNTVERIQTFLVSFILVVVVILAVIVVRADAIVALLNGAIQIGEMPDLEASGLTLMGLLGALAFAGAGGTTNLGQSNFIKDKGYGMGRYIGRITSPITGQEEATSDTGYHFRHTPENMRRWKLWWRAANIEHFFSFYLTCMVCLVLMTLICYSLLYDASGTLKPGMDQFGEGMDFVWAEATVLGALPAGTLLKYAFLAMGIAILLTTELGVLDAVSRISADIVKVNYLSKSETWSLSRLYYVFLWTEIALGVGILCIPGLDRPMVLVITAAALNGFVMFCYSALLLYLNSKILSRSISIGPVRFVALIWSCAFFGYFSFQALKLTVIPHLQSLTL